jgi:hypothetical protein
MLLLQEVEMKAMPTGLSRGSFPHDQIDARELPPNYKRLAMSVAAAILNKERRYLWTLFHSSLAHHANLASFHPTC